MTEAKCDPRVADLFSKGRHHRNLSVVYLTQNLFPQGRACRDIALNTQYLVLFNNPVDRQQVATLARRIYPSSSHIFMKQFEEATSRPYGYLVLDLKSSTPEFQRIKRDIFRKPIHEPDDNDDQNDDAATVTSIPGGKKRKYDNDEEDDDDVTSCSSERKYDDIHKLNSLHCPPGNRECWIQKRDRIQPTVIKHNTCPAGHNPELKCLLRELILCQVRQHMQQEEIKEMYPDDSDDKQAFLRKVSRIFLSNIMEAMHVMDSCPMYSTIMTTAVRLRSHLPMSLAIREAIRMYKHDLDEFLVDNEKENISDTDSEYSTNT